MELAESLRLGGCNLKLDWIKRDFNQLVDDLTKQKFDHFDAARRVRCRPEEERWHVLETFMAHASSFHMEMSKRKSDKVSDPCERKGRNRKV